MAVSRISNSTDNNIWIQMKTYPIQNEKDIDEILLNNKKDFNNVFELYMKNVQPWSKKISKPGMDLVVLESRLTPLKQKFSGSSTSLIRKNSKMYIVSFLKIKNKKGEYFSSMLEHLCENDRIIIMNGVVLKQLTRFNSNKLTVLVRPQDLSSVILFKHESLFLEKSNLLIEKNLSLLADSGVYSLYGTIKKIMKYVDEDLMLLRLQCGDKSCIKTHKYYPHSESEYKNIVKEEKITGVKYDFYSNKVDILVETPSNDFASLSLYQQIYLNNVNVKNIIGTNIFSLFVTGNIENIKADPIGIGSVSPLRPPKKLFTIPTDLRPVIRLKIKQISNDFQLVSTPSSPETNTIISPSETLPSFQQSKFNETSLLDSLSDDNVNLSPCKDFASSTLIVHKKNGASGLIDKKNVDIIDCNSSPSKNINPNQKCIDNPSLGSPKKDICLYKQREICSQRENSPCSSPDGSLSPCFFNTHPELLISNQKTLSNEPTQCIGPCRLVYTEPNIFTSSDIISGYCTKCCAFVQKCYLKFSNRSYKCPECSNIVPITFYFKMTFLYGKNESRAIQVCCYYKDAEYVIRNISEKRIQVEQYLSNPHDRTLVMNSMKSLINNKTKVNIIYCHSPSDNINIIQGIDKKYIVQTTSTQ